MSMAQQDPRQTNAEPVPEFDAVVVGAGFSGLYMLHRLRDSLGLTTRVFEAGDVFRGTRYWNPYPGARCDSGSVYHTFFDRFSAKALHDRAWSEIFPLPPEHP